ncbi:RidA family protein [Aquimarina sp. MMG016]|uniref:RidA family protein n=1 Tax=Aquimarina sp. MMG016 TaxID=2822690 RepID=UPI001B3A0F0A|nr:RidA family protein [Aquimarina sp. MMG016]MBQ4819405.1 RidA family protein [Aquimarina sp. MMG016]
MKEVKKISTGAPWEDIVGYSRAIKIGNTIEIAGTTSPGADEYEQTVGIIKIAEKALNDLGAGLDNVVRTRMYCTDINKWETIGKAHGEFFKTIKPVTTLVEVSNLISPDIYVEIEFSAVL